jgi:7,8-dihydropterin-6-yl-methyl-4-(beta-D-ribofuranosyl)aminobenzene 5'-phosphate synthase
MTAAKWRVFFWAALLVLNGRNSANAFAASVDFPKAQITVLYDAFGQTSVMQRDWGYAALVEYSGKRILFDTGNNPDILAQRRRQKKLIFPSWISWSCRTATGITWVD